MWYAKFKVYDEEGIYSSKAKKFKVTIYGNPLNYYSDKKHFYFIGIGFLEGNEKSKKQYLKELKKDKKIHKIEINNDLFIAVTKETINKESKRHVKLFYNPQIIHMNPTVIYPDGWEENEIICFNRKLVEDILEISEKKYKLKLSHFRQKKINNIGILNILPQLTEKQKQAIILASKSGYYKYPRDIDVQDLAKTLKLSFSTFQEHLRKAENKLIPFTIQKF